MMDPQYHVAVLFGLLLSSIAAQNSCTLENFVRYPGKKMLICQRPRNWASLREELKTKTIDHQPSAVIIDCEHKLRIGVLKISDIDGDFSRILNITISRCNTTSVDVKDGSPFIVELGLRWNALATLDCTAGVAELEVLDVQRNNIAHISKTNLSGNRRLNTMLLNYNRIADVESGSFEKTDKLRFVDLSNNLIDSLGGNLFRDLVGLKVVRLAGNEIKNIQTSVFVNVHLDSLDLSHNDITTVPNSAFVNTSIISLNLSNCQIENIPSGFLSSLHLKLDTLDMSNNNIESLPSNAFVHLAHLQVIYMLGNRLTSIEQSMLPPSVSEIHFNSSATTTTQMTTHYLQLTTTALRPTTTTATTQLPSATTTKSASIVATTKTLAQTTTTKKASTPEAATTLITTLSSKTTESSRPQPMPSEKSNISQNTSQHVLVLYVMLGVFLTVGLVVVSFVVYKCAQRQMMKIESKRMSRRNRGILQSSREE